MDAVRKREVLPNDPVRRSTGGIISRDRTRSEYMGGRTRKRYPSGRPCLIFNYKFLQQFLLRFSFDKRFDFEIFLDAGVFQFFLQQLIDLKNAG